MKNSDGRSNLQSRTQSLLTSYRACPPFLSSMRSKKLEGSGYEMVKLGVQTAGCNKSFLSLVFVLTQVHIGQWSSLPVPLAYLKFNYYSRVGVELFCLPSLFLAEILLSSTTLPSLRFSALSVFHLPSLCELLRISHF